jgi:DNA-3-methyladenine glycosylase
VSGARVFRDLDMTEASILPATFYDRPVEQVARDLLGALLVSGTGEARTSGVIVETEAYGGPDDLASHAAFRKTGVVEYMYGPAGTIYVYLAYGMYPCLNIVTGPAGEPSAVLIRAVSIRSPNRDDRSASGPGRLGRFLGIDVSWNGASITRPDFCIARSDDPPVRIETGPRVGVKRGDGRNWRFLMPDHPAVSRARR